MIARNREQGDDGLDGLVKDLEALAHRLDAERYPGRAWPLPAPRPARLPAGTRAAWLAAAAVAAGVCAVLVFHARAPQPAGDQVSGVRYQVSGEASVGRGSASVRRGSPDPAEGQVPAELAAGQAPVPQVVVVEDLDSYSFIDLTAGPPVVSFAMKDSCSPTSVVAVLR
jgi:hypothetical protein